MTYKVLQIIWTLIPRNYLYDKVLKPFMQFWTHATTQEIQRISKYLFFWGGLLSLILFPLENLGWFQNIIAISAILGLIVLCILSVIQYWRQIVIFFGIIILLMTVILFSIMPSEQFILKAFHGVCIHSSIVILVVGSISLMSMLYFFRLIYQGAVQSQRIPQYCLNNWANFKKFLDKVIDLLNVL